MESARDTRETPTENAGETTTAPSSSPRKNGSRLLPAPPGIRQRYTHRDLRTVKALPGASKYHTRVLENAVRRIRSTNPLVMMTLKEHARDDIISIFSMFSEVLKWTGKESGFEHVIRTAVSREGCGEEEMKQHFDRAVDLLTRHKPARQVKAAFRASHDILEIFKKRVYVVVELAGLLEKMQTMCINYKPWLLLVDWEAKMMVVESHEPYDESEKHKEICERNMDAAATERCRFLRELGLAKPVEGVGEGEEKGEGEGEEVKMRVLGGNWEGLVGYWVDRYGDYYVDAEMADLEGCVDGGEGEVVAGAAEDAEDVEDARDAANKEEEEGEAPPPPPTTIPTTPTTRRPSPQSRSYFPSPSSVTSGYDNEIAEQLVEWRFRWGRSGGVSAEELEGVGPREG